MTKYGTAPRANIHCAPVTAPRARGGSLKYQRSVSASDALLLAAGAPEDLSTFNFDDFDQVLTEMDTFINCSEHEKKYLGN